MNANIIGNKFFVNGSPLPPIPGAKSSVSLSQVGNSPRSNFGEGGLIYYHLKSIANHLAGVYDFDSAFFNTEDCDSIINDELINEIKKKPEDWAVVLFDCHF